MTSPVDKDRSSLVDNFELQLSEVELLQSMYPNGGEFVMDDAGIIADMNDFISNVNGQFPSSRLEYTINLKTDKATFELSCAFPHDYPTVEPEIYIRSQKLTRVQQHQLNKDAAEVVAKLDRGELCIVSVLQWLQDNADSYLGSEECSSESTDAFSRSGSEEEKDRLSRYWIYSHHIYNKIKRRTILEQARELNVTGFCLPGKPGIICVEGASNDCADFWDRIKHMNWKKIMCKKMEIEEIGENGLDSMRRFDSFSEVAFEKTRNHGRDYHMDIGEFLKYLDQHNCGYVFKDYFGVDGKLPPPQPPQSH